MTIFKTPAAVPEHKRPDIEDPQEESTFIDLSDDDVAEVAPLLKIKFKKVLKMVLWDKMTQELSEAEQRSKESAGNRVNQAIKQAKDYQRRELQALQYAKQCRKKTNNCLLKYSWESQQTAQNNLKNFLRITVKMNLKAG